MRLALLLLLAGCSERRIQDAIDEANYCTTADECVDVGSKCPFGCYILVNEAEADRIERRVDRFVSTCVYDCAAIGGITCSDEGRCETLPADTGE